MGKKYTDASYGAAITPTGPEIWAVAVTGSPNHTKVVTAATFLSYVESSLGLGTSATLNVDTDGTLAANSDSLIPTQKAVKTAIAAAVTGLLDYKGATDCSANPNYPAASKGDAYLVSVAGKIGGASGLAVDAGDVFVADADNAGGTQASVGASWFILEHNLAGALLAANNLSDLASASAARVNLDVYSKSEVDAAVGGTFGGAYSSLTGIPAAIDAIDGLTPAANKLAYYTGASSAATTDLTAFGISLIGAADAAAVRTLLALGTVATLDSDTDGTLAANSDAKIATQKAVKTYVDAKLAGLSWKQAVRAATTMAGTLASSFENGDVIDGVTLATGDRILIKNQASGSENGIYVVAASGAPARASDADSGAELVNASVYASEGTVNADTQWTCSTNAPITPGVTSLAFAQFISSSYNDEAAQDAVGGIMSGTGLATSTYDDGANTIVIDVPAAVASDLNTGTNTTKGVTADALAGSNFGTRVVQLAVTDPAASTAITTGDGKAYFRVPAELNGMDLVAVALTLITPGTATGLTVQIANVTQAADMLATKLTTDATETDSLTAAVPAVIDTGHDGVVTGDQLRIDFDAVPTGGKGVIVTLSFRLP
jgi:hypothetical protein